MSFLRRLSLATSGNINEVGASHFQKQKVRELKKKKKNKRLEPLFYFSKDAFENKEATSSFVFLIIRTRNRKNKTNFIQILCVINFLLTRI